jgi:peptidyl-prolyl cis-trans isomerase D
MMRGFSLGRSRATGVTLRDRALMLTAIRTTFAKGIARWILIFLMSILIVSFGIWGIQDVFRGFGSNEVLAVGDTSVSLATFQHAYNQDVRQISRRVGKPLTPSEARALGLDKQALARIASAASLDEQAKNYGLALSPEKIAAVVLDDPTFKNASGQFDKGYFAQVLRDNGYSEAGFFEEQRKTYLRDQIAEAIAGKVSVPKAMQEAFARYGAEMRSIAYVTLTDAVLGDIGQPGAGALATFYEERKGEFRAPEYRKFTYLSVTPDDLAAKGVITDDDAKADYDARKDRFVTPEKRTVQQISFPTAEEANKAAGLIASGQATFDDIAKRRKISGPDLDLGTVTRSQLLDPVVAEAAFKLTEGTPSGVVAGKLSTVILRVTKIEPEVVTPFETAKEGIKKDIALERAKKDILDLQGKIEDERAGGASLKEIANKLGLQATEILAMDAEGRDAARQPYNLPQQEKLTAAVFASDPGADTDAIDGHEAGLIWYSVDAVTPARDRTLDEAKGDVVAAWTTEEKAKRLKSRADDMLVALKAGRSLQDVAKEGGLEVKEAWSLKRNADAQGLSAAAVNQVFATPLKGFATALSGNDSDRIVFEMNESVVPAFDAKDSAAMALNRQLGQVMHQDLVEQYVKRLQSDLGLKVNQVNVNRALGSEG